MSQPVTISLDSVSTEEESKNVKEKHLFLTQLKGFVMRQLLPIGTLFSIIFGILIPQPAMYVSERIPIVQICVMVLFFFIGLRLRFHEAKSAISSYKEVLVAFILILFAYPALGTTFLNQIKLFGPLVGNQGENNLKNESTNDSMTDSESDFGPEEFRLGLQLYIMCPSAIATTLIMVTAANGHRGLSILISASCCIVSVFTIPPMLLWLIPTLEQIHVNVGKILLNIVIRILLPIIIGRSLRFLRPVKKVVKKFENTMKYAGIIFLIGVFLVNVSRASASGNLGRVSIVNVVCTVALGTSLTTFNLISSYGFLSILPGFSQKSRITLSILSSILNVLMSATIIDVLPENAIDKGLVTVPIIFVYLATLLVVNCFLAFAKVQENDSGDIKEKEIVKTGETEDVEQPNKNTITSNEVPVFTIYTDEMTIKQKYYVPNSE